MQPLQQYYAQRAPEYDQIYRKPERQPDLRAMEAELPPLFAGRSVLEIACGTGYWTQFIAPVAQRVLAIDSAPQTMQIARERITVGEVEFVEGDAYALPAQARGFDAAFAGFWWSHVPQARLDAFLQGLHRALCPGARIVFLDNRYVEGSSTPIGERDAEGNTYQFRPLADGSQHRVLKNFPTEAQLRERLAPHAQDLRYHAWTYYWAVEYVPR
jgi:demethylmenaquinone methyltransferase/2-methoxy-6-polyprenyl-1,4-benzoquinol methylase